MTGGWGHSAESVPWVGQGNANGGTGNGEGKDDAKANRWKGL